MEIKLRSNKTDFNFDIRDSLLKSLIPTTNQVLKTSHAIDSADILIHSLQITINILLFQ